MVTKIIIDIDDIRRDIEELYHNNYMETGTYSTVMNIIKKYEDRYNNSETVPEIERIKAQINNIEWVQIRSEDETEAQT